MRAGAQVWRALLLSIAVAAVGAWRGAPPDTRAPAVGAGTLIAESLHVEILAPDAVPSGATVLIAIRLTNVADRPLELQFVGRTIAFDVVVADDQGGVVWRRRERETVPAILQVMRLAPGETLEVRDRWRQRTNAGGRAPPGDYTIQGVLPSDAPQPLRTPTRTVRIESRG